ncbi:hypothetical protein [Mycolicibacterium hassiacum]|nr:hypothetical protein [Mycolicibacterium hassiacum]MBX5486707.1 hypothetical protein [Mycolicibacterium hassiacum]
MGSSTVRTPVCATPEAASTSTTAYPVSSQPWCGNVVGNRSSPNTR